MKTYGLTSEVVHDANRGGAMKNKTIIKFETADGKLLSVERTNTQRGKSGQPVLLVHGAGVRSRIFKPPVPNNLDDVLAAEGYDVWNLDWRASIDQEPNQWTLDHSAVFDYPAAVRTIIEHTNRSDLQAVVHCQGSTGFMMSLVSGLLPEVSMVISNAVSLHPIVPKLARLKALYAVPSLGKLLPYLNPQWGINTPKGWPRLFDFYVRSTHHECNNPVCKWSSFTYGAGFPTLWAHENLTNQTHDWLTGEFAHVPMSFFRQMSKSIKAGHLVSTGAFDDIPQNLIAQAPKTDARMVFLAGANNNCFLPESQARTFDFVDKTAPGKHSFHELANYGHLDVFIGRDASTEIFPLIVDELKAG